MGRSKADKAELVRRNANARLPSKEDFDDLHSIQYSDVVMDSEILDKYPDMRKMTKRQQVILASAALGLGHRGIAHAFGISKEAVQQVLMLVDPDKTVRMTKEGRKAFMTRMVEARASEAVLAITPEKLNDSSAKELTVIAKNLASISQAMNQSKHKAVSSGRLVSLMDEIEAERVSNADVTVIEETDLEMME